MRSLEEMQKELKEIDASMDELDKTRTILASSINRKLYKEFVKKYTGKWFYTYDNYMGEGRATHYHTIIGTKLYTIQFYRNVDGNFAGYSITEDKPEKYSIRYIDLDSQGLISEGDILLIRKFMEEVDSKNNEMKGKILV